VTFARNKEYEQRFLSFFTTLRAELEQAAPDRFQFSALNGQYWLTIAHVYWESRHVAYFHCSFTRTKRARVELLIDVSDATLTKRIFDALGENKADIETAFGEPLSWERMDGRSTVRIARYYPGNIMESDGALANLRARFVEVAPRFHSVLDKHLDAILPNVMLTRDAAAGSERSEAAK